MRKRNIVYLFLGASMLLAGTAIVVARELPPSGGKPLSTILKSVEGQELGVITNAEFDDGRWEIKVCKNRACLELYIDPKSGEEKRRERDDLDDELPPADAKPLSVIIQSLENRKLGVITEVEFDNGFWEVKLRKDGRRTKLDIDPRTGERKR